MESFERVRRIHASRATSWAGHEAERARTERKEKPHVAALLKMYPTVTIREADAFYKLVCRNDLSREDSRRAASGGLPKCGPTSTRRLRNKSAGAITTCPFTSHASPSTTRPRGPIAAGVAESLLGIAIGLRVPVSSRDGIVTSTVFIAHYLANVGLGINIFNTLESRQDPAREAFLARCDNAQLRRVSIMLHPPGTVVLCDEPRCGTTARPLFPRPRADRRIDHGGRQISVALCRFHQATFCRPQSADIRFSLLSRNTATSA
jgi:hypothetical protein